MREIDPQRITLGGHLERITKALKNTTGCFKGKLIFNQDSSCQNAMRNNCNWLPRDDSELPMRTDRYNLSNSLSPET